MFYIWQLGKTNIIQVCTGIVDSLSNSLDICFE